MSMRDVAKSRTICEVLREINDIHQENSGHDKMVRKKLCEAENMAKRMSKKLLEYNKNVYRGWWNKNPNYEKSLKLRLNEKYCVG